MERDELKESLRGYKEKVAPMTRGTLTWDKELIFVGRTQRGYEIEYDAEIQWGCAPTESLLLSLAACMGIDMVSFLQKMRSGLTSFKMDIAGERNSAPPQYFKSIEMVLHIAGEKVASKQVEKAIALSQEKYCSVYHSLRKDLKVTVKYFINEEGTSRECVKG